MLNSIQILRGLAAIFVVFFHTNVILPQYGGATWLVGITDFGKLGVHLFFLLSGYIILKAHHADLSAPSSIPRYLVRRAVRIYPAYWLLSLVFVGTSLVGIGSSDFSHEITDAATYISLLPVRLSYHIQPPLKVAWTLYYEMKFYLLFSIALYSARLAVGLCAAWVACIIVSTLVGYSDPLFMLPAWNLYFVMGMLVYWFSKRANPSHWPVYATASVAIFLVFWMSASFDISLDGSDNRTLYCFLPVLSLFFLSFVLLERHLSKAPAVLLFLGNASYSIYLVHSAAISVTAMLYRKAGFFAWCPPSMQFLGCLGLSLVAGSVCFLMIERPLLTYLRRFIPKRGTPRAPTPHRAALSST